MAARRPDDSASAPRERREPEVVWVTEHGARFRWVGRDADRYRVFKSGDDQSAWLQGRFAEIDRERWGEHQSLPMQELIARNADAMAEEFLAQRSGSSTLRQLKLGEALEHWIGIVFRCSEQPQDFPPMWRGLIRREVFQRLSHADGTPLRRKTRDLPDRAELERYFRAAALLGPQQPRVTALQHARGICEYEAAERGEKFMDEPLVKPMPDPGVELPTPKD